jgi:hypothetical protein
MMQWHFQSAQICKIIKTDSQIWMKTNAHMLQKQELDREFQHEGFKTELKEGRLEKQKGLN